MLRPTGAQRVAVGVDGSPESVDAARYAADAAAVRGLDLLVVHAAPPGPARGQRDDADTALCRARGHALVDEVLSHVPVAPTTVVRTLVETAPAAALLSALTDGAALVVLGQHHFDLVDGRLAGPVASAVARDARCPVVVVPGGWTRLVGGRPPRGRRPVVVAVDEETATTAALQHAYDEAELHQASVLVLHASTAPAERTTSARTSAELLAGQQQDHPDIPTEHRFVVGETVAILVDASAQASLLVLGRPHLRRGPWSWRHSVALALLRRARCPVVVVPPGAPPVPVPAHPLPTGTRVPVS